MDLVLNDEAIKDLMQRTGDHCVSLFLPTHRAGRETEQDPIRLDNLLRKAEKALTGRGMRAPDARELLTPGFELARNGFFARSLGDGLSIFIAKDHFRYFRAPIHFQEHLAVGGRFFIKPLVPILNAGKRFLILAMSQKSVRFFEATEFGISEVELKDVPQGMQEALGYDESEARLLFRTIPQAANSRGVPMFHGHGGGIEDGKEYIWQYFRKLKESLHPYLNGESAPLVFAGVEYLYPIFKLVGFYPNTLSEAIEGSPDGLDPQELLRRGLEVVAPYFRREQEKALARYMDMAGGAVVSDSLEEIVPAALSGRIDTLFLDTAIQRWGRFNAETGIAELHDSEQDGDEELLDLAASQTYLNRGSIYALKAGEIPGATEAAAIFRY